MAFSESGFHAFYAKLEVGGRGRGREREKEREQAKMRSFSLIKISNYICVRMHPTINNLIPHIF